MEVICMRYWKGEFYLYGRRTPSMFGKLFVAFVAVFLSGVGVIMFFMVHLI